jgi:hypothetical protein
MLKLLLLSYQICLRNIQMLPTIHQYLLSLMKKIKSISLIHIMQLGEHRR